MSQAASRQMFSGVNSHAQKMIQILGCTKSSPRMKDIEKQDQSKLSKMGLASLEGNHLKFWQ